jgi:hypothetical protein
MTRVWYRQKRKARHSHQCSRHGLFEDENRRLQYVRGVEVKTDWGIEVQKLAGILLMVFFHACWKLV